MKALALAFLCARPAAAVDVAALPRVSFPVVLPAFAGAVVPSGLIPSLSAPAFAPALLAAPSVVAPVPAPAPVPAAASPAPVPAAPALGERFVRVGSALVADSRAPGAAELAKALSAPPLAAFDGAAAKPDILPIVGIFHVASRRVLNGYAMGSFGVRGHSDALPPNLDRSRHGGYLLIVRPDDGVAFKGSGSVPAEITPAVRRAVLRYFGLRPADETAAARWTRAVMEAWDGLVAKLYAD
jgi:hypothetical protein